MVLIFEHTIELKLNWKQMSKVSFRISELVLADENNRIFPIISYKDNDYYFVWQIGESVFKAHLIDYYKAEYGLQITKKTKKPIISR